jgi:hypothetical protein
MNVNFLLKKKSNLVKFDLHNNISGAARGGSKKISSRRREAG